MPWKKKDSGELFTDANGNPVHLQEGDGKEFPVDYPAIISKLQESGKGEEKYRKEAAELKARLAPVADIKDLAAHLVQFNALTEELKGLKDGQGADVQAKIQAASEALEKSWKAKEKGWETQRDDLNAKLAEGTRKFTELQAQMTRDKIFKLFAESKFVAEKCDYGPVSLASIFSGQCGFDEESGRFIGKDQHGEPALGSDGKPASFDEWIFRAINEHPEGKAKMLKGILIDTPGAGGSGRREPGAANPWKKETLNITEQNRLYREQPDLARAYAKEAGIALP